MNKFESKISEMHKKVQNDFVSRMQKNEVKSLITKLKLDEENTSFDKRRVEKNINKNESLSQQNEELTQKKDDLEQKDDNLEVNDNTNLNSSQKSKSPIRWIIAVILVIVGAIYGLGTYYFNSHYFIGTKIQGYDVSLKNPVTANKLILKNVKSKVLKVKLPNRTLSISYEKSGIIINPQSKLNQVIASQNHWLWFLNFSTKEYNLNNNISMDTEVLRSTYGKQIKSGLPKVDFEKLVYFDPNVNEYVLDKTLKSKTFILSDVLQYISTAILNGKSSIQLSNSRSDNKNILKIVKKLNILIGKDIPIKFGKINDTIDKQYIPNLIKINRSGIDVNEDLLASTLQYVSKTHERISNGKMYSYNALKLLSQIKFDLERYVIKTYTAQENQVPLGVNKGSGTLHLGGSYIEANIKAQKVYAWKNGKLVKTFDVVTGDHSEHRDTPLGVWTIWDKERNKVLTGSTVGVGPAYNYKIPVKYWMAIDDTGVGLHSIDPDEVTGSQGRVYWGKDAYLIGRGSHGCVNMHTVDAGWIYDNYPLNTKVYVTP